MVKAEKVSLAYKTTPLVSLTRAMWCTLLVQNIEQLPLQLLHQQVSFVGHT